MPTCDAATLVALAKCLKCAPVSRRQAIRTYLLCQAANNGSGSGSSGTGPAAPVGFNSYMLGLGINTVWSAIPAGVDSTEIWVSYDNLTFNLVNTVPAPLTSQAFTFSSLPAYVTIRFRSGTTVGAFAPVQTCPSGRDWNYRVGLSGGAATGAGVQSAIDTFISGLSSNGILNKFYTINILAPDNLIAATVPLLNLYGLDPWTNNGFVLADLNVNGLVGDGASKYFNLGFGPSDILLNAVDPRTSFGVDVYCSATTASNTCEVGAAGGVFDQAIDLYVQFGGTTYWDCPFFAGVGRINVVRNGQQFTMGNRSAANAQQIYGYSSGAGFSTPVTGAGNVAGAALANVPFYAFRNNQAAAQYTDKRLSYIAVRQGLTLAQAQAYALLVQALRVAIGGGFV